MLLLGRKAGQTVVIGENVRVTVDCLRGRVVRLRIDAPKEIRVDREEVRRRRAPEEQSDAVGPPEERGRKIAPEDVSAANCS